MEEMPLFPLNTVLFPGMPIQLHIFEDRYKRMIRLCLDARRPFGVVLIRQGREALGPLADPFPVGCTARIRDVQYLEQGRMNIVAFGGERFRIHSLQRNAHSYLQGEVEPFSLDIINPFTLEQDAARLRRQIERYVRILVESGHAELDQSALPEDPLNLAHLAASILPVNPGEKQQWLMLESGEDFVQRLISVYRREIALLSVLLAPGAGQVGAFSIN